MVVRLSALRTGRFYPHYCYRLSRPQGHSATGRIMSLKNFNDTNGNFFCKMIHLLSSDLEIQTYMIKMHLHVKITTKRHVQFLLHDLMCMDYVFLAGSRAGATHRTCTIDCKLYGNYSFSVRLVMPRRRYRWLLGEVTPTCDAPGACGSSAMRDGLEC